MPSEASVSISGTTVPGTIIVQSGGTLHLSEVIFSGNGVSVSAAAGATVTRDKMDSTAQCAWLAGR